MSRLKTQTESSSFRDPSGFVFYYRGAVYRQLNTSYAPNYSHLLESGLYDYLVTEKLLIPHREVPRRISPDGQAYKIIRPDTIPFISYPYEWSFSQLQSAALLTLKIQLTALNYGMVLKDASAFNVQFIGSEPVFIDTASFEKYKPGTPWIAYKQFCQHFLAPLAVMAYRDIRLNGLQKNYIDGLPLDLAVNLLPSLAKFNVGLNVHLYLHAKSQTSLTGKKSGSNNQTSLKKEGLVRIINHLSETVKNLSPKNMSTPWENYYSFTNYSPLSFQKKKQIVSKFIQSVHPGNVWDLGANTGEFSKLAVQAGAYTVAFDSDIRAVEKLYLSFHEKSDRSALPLVMDITNPSPDLGWAGRERLSLAGRGKADLIMALALVHHLCLTHNLPFHEIAAYFSQLGKYLLIEFVPKHDSQIIEMLSARQDIFPWYTLENFQSVFMRYYTIVMEETIPGTARVLFLMKRKHASK